MKKQKTVKVYLDESGQMHKNSNCNYFAIGGYMCFPKDDIKINNEFKRKNKEFKDRRKQLDSTFDMKTEIKSYNYSQEERVEIINLVQDYNSFIGISKIFKKLEMRKEIVDQNLFYNFSVKILFLDLIKKNIRDYDCEDEYLIELNLDNRSVKLRNQNNLEAYLNTEFILTNFKFKVKYYDSRTNYKIQLADIIVNSIYNNYKEPELVYEIIKSMKPKNFKFTSFPNNKKRLTL